MNTYEYIILGIASIGLGVHLSKHGEIKKESKFNFFIHFIYLAINFFLLYMAGLFHNL